MKQKEKVKAPKSKDTIGNDPVVSGRGGRGRGGADSARGGRGRATERGRGAPRAGRGASTANGRIAKTSETATADPAIADSIPAGESTLDSTEAPVAASPADSWEVVAPAEAAPPVAEASRATPKPDATRTWASMLKPAPKPKPAPVAKPVAPAASQAQAPPAPVAEPEAVPEPQAPFTPAVPSVVEPSEQVAPSAPPSLPPSESNTTPLAPSEDKLTEENLEMVKDVSQPVHSDTVASTMGTEEPRSLVGTPLHGTSAPATRPGLGGFATSALKATQGGSRAASFRRVKDQQEAVVMPGSNHAVDRAAVQFGSLGLSGSDDVDDDREEAETRAQPPQHSPIAPRASLPAAAQQSAEESAAPTPRAAPGLPSNVPSDLPQVAQTDAQQSTSGHYDQFSNRFGGLPGAQAPGATNVSKPYEPFGQQLAGAGSGHHPFENYSSQSQAPSQQSQAAHSNLGGFGAGYDQYYNDYQRNAHLYGGFGQQPGQGSQESASSQRAAGAFGSTATDPSSQYATSHAPHNRFAGASDALNSGHSTPAPGAGQQGQSQASGQTHGQSQAHGQGQQHGGHAHAAAPYGGSYNQYAMYNNSPFSYGGQTPSQTQQQHQQTSTYGRDRPAFDDARRYEEYTSQQNHYGYGGYGGYQGGPYSGGKYNQPHQYGTSYDGHGASPANTFGRDSGAGSFGYGRTSSTQPDNSQQSQHQSSAYGGMNDPFGRGSSAFPGQSSSQQQGAPGDENSRFGTDSSKIATGGPSPAPAQQRPDSAVNSSQSGPQQNQHAYGNYPQNLGGFGSGHQGSHQGGHQGHQQGGYGGFGGAGYGYSYGSGNRGGWAGYGGGH